MNKKLQIQSLQMHIQFQDKLIEFYAKQNAELLNLVDKQETQLIDLNVLKNTILNDLQNEILYIKSDNDLMKGFSSKPWLLKDLNSIIRKLK